MRDLLLLSSPTRNRPDEWQVVSGSLEAAESVLAGVLREVKEEAGPQIQVRPLGVVHAHTFHFDAQRAYRPPLSHRHGLRGFLGALLQLTGEVSRSFSSPPGGRGGQYLPWSELLQRALEGRGSADGV